jgi:hypothetical protein
VEISRFASSTFFACCGLHTSKTRQSRANATPFSAIFAVRSCTPSTPKPCLATAASRSAATRSIGFSDSTM